MTNLINCDSIAGHFVLLPCYTHPETSRIQRDGVYHPCRYLGPSSGPPPPPPRPSWAGVWNRLKPLPLNYFDCLSIGKARQNKSKQHQIHLRRDYAASPAGGPELGACDSVLFSRHTVACMVQNSWKAPDTSQFSYLFGSWNIWPLATFSSQPQILSLSSK